VDWLNAVVQGTLLGGLYALFATGLSLIFGVMRLVNIAHGDFIVLAAYLGLSVSLASGIPPLLCLAVVLPAMAGLGYVLQRRLLDRTLGDDILPPLLVTFGLSVVIQNALLEVYTADPRKLDAGTLETSSVDIGLTTVGVLPLFTFAVAVATIAGLHWTFYHTRHGRAFRAVSDNREVAQLVGLNRAHVYGLAMALSLAVAGLAGILLGIRTSFDPTIGGGRLLLGFEAVIIGGLGSLWGTLAGGIVLGVAQSLGALSDPGWQLLAGHLAFLALLVLRPRGLFPRIDG
jgi:branched-chain amino acid transport system permease protein